MVHGQLREEPHLTSMSRERRGGPERSCVQVGHGQGQVGPEELPRVPQASRRISLGGRGAGPLGTGASGLPGREAKDTPSRHVPRRTGIQFPVLLTRDKGGDPRACRSCACSSARGSWGLEPGACIYWLRLRLAPVGEVRQGGQVTGSRQLGLRLCQAAHCILWPPVSMQSLGRVPAWPAQAWVPMFGSLELLLGRQC